ncbi:MAG: bacteriohemerythrin [Terracidiphilus sp.]|jgi:hemerythrin
MPLLEWNESMSVGIKVIDDDHKKLIDMLNELNEGILAGKTSEALEDVIEGLLRYTRYHFAREERLFAQTGYPGGAAHKAEHDLLTRRVSNLQARFETGQSIILSMEAMEFLKNWLTNHIMGSDQEYGPHLNAKGIH